MKVMTLRMPDEVAEWLDALALAYGTSRTALVLEALEVRREANPVEDRQAWEGFLERARHASWSRPFGADT